MGADRLRILRLAFGSAIFQIPIDILSATEYSCFVTDILQGETQYEASTF